MQSNLTTELWEMTELLVLQLQQERYGLENISKKIEVHHQYIK